MTYAVYELKRDGEVHHDFISKATNLYDAFHEAIHADNRELSSVMTDPLEIKQDLQTRLARTEVRVRHQFRPNENKLIARAIKHLDDERRVIDRIKEHQDPGHRLLGGHNRAIFAVRRHLADRLSIFSLKDSRTYRHCNNRLLAAVVSCDEVLVRLEPSFAEEPRLPGFFCEAYNTQRPQLEM